MPLLIPPVASGPRFGLRPYVSPPIRGTVIGRSCACGIASPLRRTGRAVHAVIADGRVVVIRDDKVIAVVAAGHVDEHQGLVRFTALGWICRQSSIDWARAAHHPEMLHLRRECRHAQSSNLIFLESLFVFLSLLLPLNLILR